jgi:hypothetical protein
MGIDPIFYPFTMAMTALTWCMSKITGVIAYLVGYSLRLTFYSLRTFNRFLKKKLTRSDEAPEVQKSAQN